MSDEVKESQDVKTNESDLSEDKKSLQDAEPKTYTEEEVRGLLKNKNDILAEKKAKDSEVVKLKAQIENMEKTELEKKEEWQKLYESEKSKRQNEKLENQRIRREMIAKDFHNPALIHAYERAFQYDEAGNITNGEAVIEALKEKEPYLFKQNETTKQTVNVLHGQPGPAKTTLTREEQKKLIDDNLMKAFRGG